MAHDSDEGTAFVARHSELVAHHSGASRVWRRMVAILTSRPKFFGQIVIVVRDGKIEHIRTEETEKVDELP